MEKIGNYRVQWEEYTKRHYIKVFEKKYKTKWAPTVCIITTVCEHIDNMLRHERADLICAKDDYKLIKLDFAIDGSQVSPKASGNRCILFVNEKIRLVKILLVYSKNDICAPNETQKWKSIIKEQFPEVKTIFAL